MGLSNRDPIPAKKRGQNWECPHCGVRVFTLSLSWHLYMRHDITLNPVEYSREVYQWRGEGTHTERVLLTPGPHGCTLNHTHCEPQPEVPLGVAVSAATGY